MNKNHNVRWTDQKQDELAALIKRWKETNQTIRCTWILSKVGTDGPNCTDHQIAKTFGHRPAG